MHFYLVNEDRFFTLYFRHGLVNFVDIVIFILESSMKTKIKTTLALCVPLALSSLTLSCGKDSDGGGSGGGGHEHFVNTDSADTFESKADKGSKIVGSMGSVKENFVKKPTVRAAFLSTFQGVLSRNTTNPGQTGGRSDEKSASESIDNFKTDPKDCSEAFAGFESLYGLAEKEYTDALEKLKDPTLLNDPSLSLTEAPKKDDEAVAYIFKPSDDSENGITTVTGRLSGGSSGDLVKISMELAVVMDYSKIPNFPEDQTGNAPAIETKGSMTLKLTENVEVNLAERLAKLGISMDNSSEFNAKVSKDFVSADIAISDGKDRYVSANFEVKATHDGVSNAMNGEVKAQLVDEDTIIMSGKAGAPGKEESVSYKIVREESGSCKISN